jgi:hypothetical protein
MMPGYILNTLLALYKLDEYNSYYDCLEKELKTIVKYGYNFDKLNEAQSNFFETQKSKIDELIKSIDEIWNKYLSNMEDLKKRLPNIKEIIKKIKSNKENINFTYELYPYWKDSSYLSRNDFPKFIISNQKLMDSLSSTEDFHIKYLNKYLKSGEDISQSYLQFIQGGIQKNKLSYEELSQHFEDIFGYFDSFATLIESISSQYSLIQSSYQTFENSVLKKVNVTNENTLFIFNENKVFSELDNADYTALRESVHILCEDIKDPRTQDKQDFKANGTFTNKDAKVLVDKYIIYIKEYYKILSVKMKLTEQIFLVYEDLLKNIEKKV